MLADGVGAGLQTVATFIPVVGCLFLFLAVLESSGYLARAAFVVDALMRRLGLPGKAFVPMLMGFGCTVPAVMATRTLGSERERLMTSAMAPFMSCGCPSAGLRPVRGGLLPRVGAEPGVRSLSVRHPGGGAHRPLPAQHPAAGQERLHGDGDARLRVAPSGGRGAAHLAETQGLHLRRGQDHRPDGGGAERAQLLGTDGSFGNQDQENSVLSKLSQSVTPVLHPIGVRDDNWQATVGILTGIFAKEAVVATLNSLYAGGAGDEEESEYPCWAA